MKLSKILIGSAIAGGILLCVGGVGGISICIQIK